MRNLKSSTAFTMTLALICYLNFHSASQSFGQSLLPSGFGVSAGASTFSSCPSFCTGDADFDSDGGELASIANAISTTYGLSQASAYYAAPETYLPELKALSFSTSGQGGSASAFGVQGYTYDGTVSTTITIDFELDAEVLDSGTFGDESTSASLGVLGADSFVAPLYFSDFGTWYFENLAEPLGNDSLFVDGDTAGGVDNGSVSFSVDPGDSFFVGASLRASSRTGTADAFNTFTASFSDPAIASQLIVANPVAAAVPEPSSIALLSLFAASMITRRTKR